MYLNSDFISFLTGAKTVLSERRDLYSPDRQLNQQKALKFVYKNQTKLYPQERLEMALPFRNLAAVALMFVPLVYIPGLTAFKIFILINLILLIFVLTRLSRDENLIFYYLFLLSLFFLPVLTSLYRGQLTIIALLIFVYIYRLLKDKKSFLCGLFAGLLFIKIQYLVAVPFLILMIPEQKKFLRGFTISAAMILFISLVLSGRGLLDYPGYLLLTDQSGYGSIPSEILTIYSVIKRITDYMVFAATVNLILYVLVIYVFRAREKSLNLDIKITLIILSTLLFGIHMTDNEVVLLLLPLILIIKSRLRLSLKLVFTFLTMTAPVLRFTPLAFFEIIVLLLLESAVLVFVLNKNVYKYNFFT